MDIDKLNWKIMLLSDPLSKSEQCQWCSFRYNQNEAEDWLITNKFNYLECPRCHQINAHLIHPKLID